MQGISSNTDPFAAWELTHKPSIGRGRENRGYVVDCLVVRRSDSVHLLGDSDVNGLEYSQIQFQKLSSLKFEEEGKCFAGRGEFLCL